MLRPRPGPTLFPYTTLFRSREAGQSLGDPLPAQPLLAFEILRLVVGRRVPLEGLDVAHRDGDDHVGDDKDGEDDGHVESLVVADRKSTRLNSSHDQISYAVF